MDTGTTGETSPMSEDAGIRPIRVAVVGTSWISRAHCHALLTLNHIRPLACMVELTILCGRTPQNVDRLAEEFSFRRRSLRWEDAVEDRDIDVVAVLTANPLHAAVTRAALDNGKAVLCEKPLAVGQARGLRPGKGGAAHPSDRRLRLQLSLPSGCDVDAGTLSVRPARGRSALPWGLSPGLGRSALPWGLSPGLGRSARPDPAQSLRRRSDSRLLTHHRPDGPVHRDPAVRHGRSHWFWSNGRGCICGHGPTCRGRNWHA